MPPVLPLILSSTPPPSGEPQKTDVIAAAMTADHLQFLKGSAKEIRGMFCQRVLRDWGHAAHLGWARLLHDRRRDLIERHPPSHQHDEREFYANRFYQNREQFPARH